MIMIPSLLIDLIKRFEGLRLKAYQCPSGVWTIGYGHTGDDVTKGLCISLEQANDLLLQDASKYFSQTFQVSPLLINAGSNRISAIGDFLFNLGVSRYRGSTLRKRVDEEDWEKASHECKRWVFVGGKKFKGLIVRREVEAELLLRD